MSKTNTCAEFFICLLFFSQAIAAGSKTEKIPPQGVVSICQNIIKEIGSNINRAEWDTAEVSRWIEIVEKNQEEVDGLLIKNFGPVKSAKNKRDGNPLQNLCREYDLLLSNLKKYNEVKIVILTSGNSNTTAGEQANQHSKPPEFPPSQPKDSLSKDSVSKTFEPDRTFWFDLDKYEKPQFESIERQITLLFEQIKQLRDKQKAEFETLSKAVEKSNKIVLEKAVNTTTFDSKYAIRNSYTAFRNAYTQAIKDKLL